MLTSHLENIVIWYIITIKCRPGADKIVRRACGHIGE